ncbi:MAG: tetratricopeptide repeat protein [Acidobacteriota bacterium]
MPEQTSTRVSSRAFVALAAALGILVVLAGPAAGAEKDRLFLIQQLIDREQPGKALELLETLTKGKPSPEERMLRGTARIMLGELKAGAADLEKALDDDPTLRQGWLNLAGLEIAEGNYPEAHDALVKARDLDPRASDAHLNLGAVLILMGRRPDARTSFDRYLELEKGNGEAHYLVASNYALGGVEHLAIEALGEAIRLDERLRMRARRDDRFLVLESLEYRVLLHTDAYEAPEGYHQVAAAFRQPYSGDNQLLYAVTDALKEQQIRYDPEIEATARWALIWSEDGQLRLKITNQENGTGVVSLSASPNRFTGEEWDRLSQQLFRAIHGALGE